MVIIDDACGRYALTSSSKDIAKRYNIARVPADIKPNYNAAPGQVMPVVVENEDGSRDLQLMRWGLIPIWAKDPSIGYKLINARDDTIFTKPMWRSVILKKRALIPASGFFEWQKPPSGSKERKKPFYIHPKQTDLFSFAGVWSSWQDSSGQEVKSYSIITTEPNKEMSSIHNRMPIMLHQEEEASWLEPSKVSREDVEPYLHPYEDNGLEMYQVSDDVNSTKNNKSYLLEPVSAIN